MKNIFNRLPKKLIAGVVLFAVTLAGVGAISAALIGGDREVRAYNGPGTPGFDHVTFNSFTNVPNIGDERNFFHGKISQAPNGFYDPMNGVRGGDELLVRVYVHNNADPKHNASGKGVAKNTRVRVQLPSGEAQNQVAHAFVSADNATPKTIEDTLNIVGQYPVGLQYVTGSARVKTNFMDKALSDEVVKSGVQIGDDALDGNMNGCFEFVALVTMKVKIVAPAYTLDKKVSVSGKDTFAEEVSVNAGDKVDFVLGFKNMGSVNLNNVVIGDKLPTGLTYVPGSTQFISGHTGNKWVKSESDNVVKGGVSIGDYAPNGAGYVKFTATVADASKLECGNNNLVNTGFAKPSGRGTIEDKASVKVSKKCENVPTFACKALTAKLNGKEVTLNLDYSVSGGAKLKTVTYNFGDGSAEMVTDKTKDVKHAYAKDGEYKINATLTFVAGNNTHKVECSTSVKIGTPTTPPTTPPTLPDTGAGDIIGIFAAVTVAGSVAHRVFTRRIFG